MREYIQSTEEYKGFTLEIRMYCLTNNNRWNRQCKIYRNGKCIGVSKTKKELKDLINHGIYDKYIKDGQ